jgi:hypothetical protein
MRRLALAVILLAPAVARADWALHLDLGGGGSEDQAVVEVALRADALLVGPRAHAAQGWGLGPTVELRSADLETAEAGAGLAAYLPGDDVGFTVSLLGGVASRADAEDGAYLAGRLAFGLRVGERGFAPTTAIYVDARRGLGDDGAYEIVAGVELGGALVAWLLRGAVAMGQ